MSKQKNLMYAGIGIFLGLVLIFGGIVPLQVADVQQPQTQSQSGQSGTTVDVFLKPQHVCDANTFSCGPGGVIYKCNQYGSSNDVFGQCQGNFDCGVDFNTKQPICTEPYKEPPIFLYLVLSLVVIVASTLVYTEKVKKKK